MLKISLDDLRPGGRRKPAAPEVRKWDGQDWAISVPQPEWNERNGEGACVLLPAEPGWYRIDITSGSPFAESGLSDKEAQVYHESGLAEPRAAMPHPAPFRLAEGTLWGYIADNGRTVIEPHYEYAEEFQPNGLAVVQRNGMAGLIDHTGRETVKPSFNYIGTFSEGSAPASDSKGYLLINEKGKPLTGRRYEYLNGLKDGRALFSRQIAEGKTRYGYLDREGREAIPPVYEDANEFSGCRALVKLQDNEFALIDTEGTVLHTYHFPYVGTPGDGLLPYQETENGRYGYIREDGSPAIAPQFTSALPFFEGRAVVNTAENFENGYGLIDASGRFIVQPGYEQIEQLGENVIALGVPLDPAQTYRGTVFSIANAETGAVLNAHPLRGVDRYSQGFASVYDEHETYMIDKTGRRAPGMPVVPGTGNLSFSGRLIRANVDQRTSYYNRDGVLVWSENTLITLRPPYAVQEIKFRPNFDYLVYYPVVKGIANPTVMESVNKRLKELSLPDSGTPAGERTSSYTGDFSVSFFRKNLLQLELQGYNYPFGAAHGMPTRIYTKIDLRSGVFYQLKDLFKPSVDYTGTLSDIVARQIKSDPQYSYVFPDAFKGIAPDQPFFVDADALYLYFNPYDIAPYAAGFPTFRIPFAQIMGLINTDGAFWRSFH
ncbi:KWG Leptospira [compost metagenome]